jgi:hypothetical protein
MSKVIGQHSDVQTQLLSELIILVNEEDVPVGSGTKGEGFSLIIFTLWS